MLDGSCETLMSGTVAQMAAQTLFDVHIGPPGADHVVHIRGDLDLASRDITLRACLEGCHPSIIVDLDELTFMDCAGYGGLLAAQENIEHRGGTFRLVNPRGEPARLLSLIHQMEV
jgi:anti-anti-sigma factor